MYSIDTNSRLIILNNPVVKGTQVEIEILTIISTEMPISDEINSASTNETTAGSKAVYDFVNESIEQAGTIVVKNSDVFDITGSIQNIAANETKTADVEYPTGFNKANTHIIGKMTSNNNVYYDSIDLTSTANGFPVIKMVALLDDVIRVWLTNTNSSTAKIGHFKITLLKK